jgi:hypothetical protein
MHFDTLAWRCESVATGNNSGWFNGTAQPGVAQSSHHPERTAQLTRATETSPSRSREHFSLPPGRV